MRQEFDQEEVSEILNRAIARQAAAPLPHEEAGTLDQALEIARQLNVPEEHVLAAAEEVRLRRGQARTAEERAVQRAWKRGVARQRRQRGFLASLVGSVALGGLITAFLGPDVLGLIPLVIPAFAGLRLFTPVSNEDADRVEVMPVAGQCRVCGNEAHTPQSTFCDEHRFKPGG